ncbi:MAG: lysophospholipid acyltransferase family protein [Chitinispirillaceae bacterium]|nr:lysophospholipid acyltransferase family protein [Chitinispirillaceae bacterium]
MRKTKKISHFFEYVTLRITENIVKLLPRKIALFLGSILGKLLYLSGFYRKIVIKNIEHTGLWDKEKMKKIVKELYKNMGKYIVDFLRQPHIMPEYTIHNFDKIEPFLKMGKGVIVILGHLGNWEMLSVVFGKSTGRLSVVAKPMNNPLVENWLFKKRALSNVNIIYTQQALRKILEALKKDRIVAVLIDQYIKEHSTEIPFLGKPAKTVRSIAGLTLKSGSPVISTYSIMRKNGRYDIFMVPPLQIETSKLSEEEAITLYQKLHNEMISQQIISYPEHYFGWFHRRFKEYLNYT